MRKICLAALLWVSFASSQSFVVTHSISATTHSVVTYHARNNGGCSYTPSTGFVANCSWSGNQRGVTVFLQTHSQGGLQGGTTENSAFFEVPLGCSYVYCERTSTFEVLPSLFELDESDAGYCYGSYWKWPAVTGTATYTFNCPFDCADPAVAAVNEFCSDGNDNACDLDQIAANAEAFITGNNNRYELFELNCTDRTIIPVPLTSSTPFCNNLDCENVAVSIDKNGNYIDDGWSTGATQAIWVDPENLECNANSDGYFVFCSQGGGGMWDNAGQTGQLNQAGGGSITSGGLGSDGELLPPDRVDTIKFIPPNNQPTESNVSNLIGALGQTVQNGFNSLGNKIDNLNNNMSRWFSNLQSTITNGWDWLKTQFEPQEDPVVDVNLDMEDPTGEFNPEKPELPEIELPEFDIDSLAIKQELDTSFVDKLKEQLDSLLNEKPEEEIEHELMEKVEEIVKELFNEITENVTTALAPIREALPQGSGGCNCLASAFDNFNVGFGIGSVTIGSMVNTRFICDNIEIIRKIIMVVVGIMCFGMVLATLRGGN